jgi:hypothetical protein
LLKPVNITALICGNKWRFDALFLQRPNRQVASMLELQTVDKVRLELLEYPSEQQTSDSITE